MTIRTEWLFDGAAQKVVLNRPKANILDADMLRSISEFLGTIAPETKALIFEGAGDHFSFGASVAEHKREHAAEMLRRFHAVFRQLLALSVPTIAVVRGQCLGGGLELASFASWIFASDTAVFGQPEIRLGVFPPVASVLLPWRLGGGAALDLCVSGRTWTAAEAKERGLVHQIVADPAAAAETFIHDELLPKSASSLRFAERAARHSLDAEFDGRLRALEAIYLGELMTTRDANEGIQSFIEKRAPRFQNQ
jgi:cyclohexa-1,5-dienecarbonyl-CoA hydratase